MAPSRLIPLALLALPSLAWAEDIQSPADKEKSVTVSKILVVSHPIFDESAENTFFLHNWANFLHINTKEQTVLNNLSFKEGDVISEREMAEAQRILRAEHYLRDSRITVAQKDPLLPPTNDDVVVVETWDNWSLLPTLSFSRSGGKNKFSVGVKEDNLLGRGISTSLKYQSTEDRTGYKLAVDAPVNWLPHDSIRADVHNNSDGQAARLFFIKPFFTLHGNNQYSIDWLKDTRDDTLRRNGEDVAGFERETNYFELHYGTLLSWDGHLSQRLLFGITQNQQLFEPLEKFPGTQLPKNRDFLYPWVALESIEDRHKVFHDIRLINFNEDINLGWQHFVKLGFETRDIEGNTPGIHLDWRSSRGFLSSDSLWLLEAGGDALLNTTQADKYNLQIQGEWFYRISNKWKLYNRIRLVASKNNFIDEPLTQGDDSGMRGYPDAYQWGDYLWQVTGEIRHYPNIHLYQLAELGWAMFADAGQAFGEDKSLNDMSGPLASVGIGARIYSSRSSYGNVAHIDFSVPLRRGPGLDSWEWRFLIRRHF
ncbi:MAG: hypothetical protein LPD71_13875 [Shewanella sp.]|nr:hypothetical protein [Shewanella sp.]